MNNKILLHILATLLCILSLTACNRADEWEATGGDTGLLVTLTDGTHGVETRATPQELREQLGDEFLDQFRLTITHVTGDHEEYGPYPYDGELIRVPAGFYDVEATFGDNPTLALDAPYYTGRTEDVEVKGHQQKSVSIACSVANALLSVKYENVDKLDEKFTNYYVSVQVDEESVDIKNTKQSAYFRAGSSPRLYFCCDGREPLPLTGDAIPETFQAGDHLILTLRMSPTLTMEIAKVEMKQVTVEETVPKNWLPKPKIEAVGFGKDNTLTFAETEKKEAKLNLNTQLGLQDLKLTFQFEDEQFASLNGKEYQLSNPTDKAAVEQALDITLPEVGTKGASLDLSPLIARMQTKGGETVTNRLTIDVRANDRWSSEDAEANRTYTMVCNKPEFSIAVQPGNVWTKQFTIDEVTVTAGDAETIKEQLQYQYKEEGSDVWVNNTEALIRFSETPAIKKYKVRGLYRNTIATAEIDVELETPEQLPNPGMEEWNTEIYNDNYYSFNPWASNANPFWDTNNDYTTRHRYNSSSVTIANYNGFHAVSYVTGRGGSGLAAELRSTANGRGNTRYWAFGTKHEEKDINKVAGQLYTGTAQVKMTGNDISGADTYTIDKNASFPSRPTSLQFYYKYAPYNTDAWSAHIELLDESKNIIIQKDYQSSEAKSDWTQATLTLDYAEGTLYAKCKYIYVIFCSTTNPGGNMPYREITQTFYVLENGALSAKTFSPAYIGSVLTIDDISLIYDK